MTETQATLAPFSRRFGALLVDWILCLLVAGAFGSPTRQPWLAPAVLTLEYGGFVGFFTQTPGMWLTRIRCVAADGGGPIGPLRALLRGLLINLIVPPLVMDSYGRGLHDKAAGSVMLLREPPTGPASP